jgi:aminoglycoside/choline kinase family phosphotransferase
METTIKQDIIQNIHSLLTKNGLTDVLSVEELPPSGSSRIYFRILTKKNSIIAAYNPDEKENKAFIEFTRHFLLHHINVPQIIDSDLLNHIYLLSDLGDTTLFSIIEKNRKGDEFSSDLILIYKQILDDLPKFQRDAGKNLDYSYCYPRDRFDRQSMMWDLNYFKYYFLKLAKVHFDEQLLEDDFQTFVNYLSEADDDYFLYRDFQSRNIMIQNNNIYYIDYQGGRKGALQYDVASLLYDAKANIPQDVRNLLLDYYIENLNKYAKVDENKFRRLYYGFVLIRILQALGAYGFRGFYEKKEHFLLSIPFAIKNLNWILKNIEFDCRIPTLLNVIHRLCISDELKKFNLKVLPVNSLEVRISSFSYRNGIPADETNNGGGFVFDCRALPNPGNQKVFECLNGTDKPVIDFFEKEDEVKKFTENIFKIIEQSVEKYIHRNFNSLQVAFGCTGGQHRSVFLAEMLAKHLESKYKIKIILTHINRLNWKKPNE